MPGAPRRAARRQNVMPSFGTLRNSANNSRRPANPSSVWTRKKKELVGNFKNAGRAWRRTAEAVLVHDWPQDAIGQAIPYGVYDLTNNRGFVCIGDCFDTPRFAVEAGPGWGADDGRRRLPPAERLLILAGAGRSDRRRAPGG